MLNRHVCGGSCKRDHEALKRGGKNGGSVDLQMFLMFLVLTIRRCDLLNPLPSFDQREPTGWESGRRRSVTFIFSRPLGSAAKVIKERRAVHSGVVCISARACVCVCVPRVLLGRESGRTLEDRYSWHFFQSLLCDPHLSVSERLVVGTVSHGEGVHSQLCVSGAISYPMGGSNEGKSGAKREAVFYILFLLLHTGTLSQRGLKR